MAEVTFDVRPATPQKRCYDGSILSEQSTGSISERTESVSTQEARRATSPAPSTDSTLTELSVLETAVRDGSASASGTGAPPAKKRKLGFIEQQAEKAAKQRAKEEREKIKADEKQRKMDEKAARDEEKRKKAEEKEAERRVKELEKAEKAEQKKVKEAAKEAAKQKEEEERLKKERAQTRLGAFFAKPKPEATPPSTPDNVSEGARSRRSSIASIKSEKNDPPIPSPQKPVSSRVDFDRWILPFFVLEYTDVAPYNRFKQGKSVDFTLPSQAAKHGLSEHFKKHRPRRARKMVVIRDVMKNMQESGVDATELDTTTLNAIQSTPFKVLHFREDVRPPYQGTYTRSVSVTATHKLARNPFTRELPETNYDYDSEAEWEPPGEDDEDLGDDDEMSDADDAEDEMADFLDDENDIVRKKGPTSDMVPLSSGLCWADESYDDRGMNLVQYRMDFLHDSTKFPIDPFSTDHWTDDAKPKAAVKQENNQSSMQPPAQRQPLSSLSPNASSTSKSALGVDGKPIPTSGLSKTNSSSSKPTRLVATELIPDFKRAIDGSKLTKTGLIEVLKAQFTQCPKDAIKSTLEAVARREGKKEADKRWVLVDT